MKDYPNIEFKEVKERPEDGAMVRVAKLKSSISSGYNEVVGKFDLENLSLEATYEILWEITFEYPKHLEHCFEKRLWRKQRNKKQSKRRIATYAQHRDKNKGSFVVDELEGAVTIYTKLGGREMCNKVDMLDMSSCEWIRIPGGVFETHPATEREVEFSLFYKQGINKLDLVIKGFIVQPKL